MTTKTIIENITAWANEHICSKLEFKVPDDYSNDDRYEVSYMKPTAFPLYVPAKDRLAPEIQAPIPSLCVQMMEGSDDIQNSTRSLKIRFCLSTWNPGIHKGDLWRKVDRPPVQKPGMSGQSYTNEILEGDTYQRNSDGWIDLYNFQDVTLAELQKNRIFAGVELDLDTPITYGPFTEDGTIWDYYPYWNGWISFNVISGVPKGLSREFDDLL